MNLPQRELRMTALAVCALLVLAGGCHHQCRVPQLDPTGKHLFVMPPVIEPSPHKPGHHTPAGICLNPAQVVAPVGSEVLLVAGVNDPKGTPQVNRRVEWSLEPGGVGHFIDVAGADKLHLLHSASDRPRKVTQTYAIGNTLKHATLLTRGTPTPEDDAYIQRGQTWVTVTSPVEGESFVTAHSPQVFAWDAHTKTSNIVWVDAQWAFPPPTINPAGTRQTLTTVVTRFTDRGPATGWRVRYEIVDGPSAGFAPDGQQVVEVGTNELGQASVEIFQQQPSSGTNQINVQLIRPAELGGVSNRRLVLATAMTSVTWSTPDAELIVTGPSQAAVGATLTYRVDVRNPGNSPISGAVATIQPPQGLTLTGSTPQPDAPGTLRFNVGSLAPGESRTISLDYRADQAGMVTLCANLTTAEGMTAQNCATTTVMAAALDIRVEGPTQASVGSQVGYNIRVTNRGGVPATGLTLFNRFDVGLTHEVTGNSIEATLDDLAPGASATVDVYFTVTQPGRLCQRIEVVGRGGLNGQAEACLQALGSAGPAVPPGQPAPPVTPPPTTTPQGRASVKVNKLGPTDRVVGSLAEFVIEITNDGEIPLTNVKLVDSYDEHLEPQQATDGFAVVGQDLVWMVDQLPVGKTIVFQINCRCRTEAPRSCNRVTVTSDQEVRADAEACLEIRPPPPGLTLSISDLTDPIGVGRELTYEIRVENRSTEADSNVVLEVTLPAQLEVAPIGIRGPANFKVESNRVLFEPVAEVPAGATLTYRLRARALQPGDARVTASLRSRRLVQPLVESELTSIFAGP